jgi:hypothetical protein
MKAAIMSIRNASLKPDLIKWVFSPIVILIGNLYLDVFSHLTRIG